MLKPLAMTSELARYHVEATCNDIRTGSLSCWSHFQWHQNWLVVMLKPLAMTSELARCHAEVPCNDIRTGSLSCWIHLQWRQNWLVVMLKSLADIRTGSSCWSPFSVNWGQIESYVLILLFLNISETTGASLDIKRALQWYRQTLQMGGRMSSLISISDYLRDYWS